MYIWALHPALLYFLRPEINWQWNIKRTLFSNHYPSPSLRIGFERRSRGRKMKPVPHPDPVAPTAGHPAQSWNRCFLAKMKIIHFINWIQSCLTCLLWRLYGVIPWPSTQTAIIAEHRWSQGSMSQTLCWSAFPRCSSEFSPSSNPYVTDHWHRLCLGQQTFKQLMLVKS